MLTNLSNVFYHSKQAHQNGNKYCLFEMNNCCVDIDCTHVHLGVCAFIASTKLKTNGGFET